MPEHAKKSYLDMGQFMKLAVEFEQDSVAFYREMRESGLAGEAAWLVGELENQEKDHVRILRAFEAPKDADILIQFAPELSLSMPPVPREKSFPALLEVAIARERKSVEIYENAAEATVGAFKELVQGLSDFEREHERKLRTIQAPRA